MKRRMTNSSVACYYILLFSAAIMVADEPCRLEAFAAAIQAHRSHELYPYLVRSCQILERLAEQIARDRASDRELVTADAEALASEYDNLAASLKEELRLIGVNSGLSYRRFDVKAEGADPSGSRDSLAALERTVAAAKAQGNGAEVFLPKGTYLLGGAWNLRDLSNMRIVGEPGTELIFTTSPADKTIQNGINITACSNLRLVNLTLDWKTLPWTQATVVKIEGNDLVVRFDPGYSELSPWHNDGLRFYDAATGLLLHTKYITAFDKAASRRQSDGTWRLPSQAVDLAQIGAGTKVVILSRDLHAAGYGPDMGYGIRLLSSQYVTLDHVNIYAAYDANILQFNTTGVKLIGCNIVPRPGTDRLVSGNTDTFMTMGDRKGYYMTKSRIYGGMDDGTNLGPNTRAIVGWQDARTCTLTGPFEPLWNVYRPGDGLWIVDPTRGPFVAFAKAQSVTAGPDDTIRIVFDRDIPASVREVRILSYSRDALGRDIPSSARVTGQQVLNVNAKNDGFVIVDNDFGNGTANGLLVFASHGLIENNRICHFFYAGVYLRMDFSWNLVSAPRNVLLTGNTITNDTGVRVWLDGTKLAAGAPIQYVFRGLAITSNTITARDPVVLNHVADSVIADNVIKTPDPSRAITLDTCDAVTTTLRGNAVSTPHDP